MGSEKISLGLMVKNINPSQFPERRQRVNSHNYRNSHCCQQNPSSNHSKQPQRPVSTTHSARPRHQHSRPNTAKSIPPHTSQAAERRTAPQPNMHRPASSKLSFEP